MSSENDVGDAKKTQRIKEVNKDARRPAPERVT